MGLFDFFRRKPATPPDSDPVEEAFHEPRCHHYTLAHYALRSVAFDHPLGFLGVLASPDARGFLSELMRSVSEHCKEREPRPDFDIDDIAVHKVRVGKYPCAVVEMPRPRATTEAFFVAAVLLADLDREMPDPKEVALRYFTLEKGFTFEGPPRTVLCEWTSEGCHCNYGDGPAPRLEAFLRAVEEMLSKRP
jgi:hypothetical protein